MLCVLCQKIIKQHGEENYNKKETHFCEKRPTHTKRGLVCFYFIHFKGDEHSGRIVVYVIKWNDLKHLHTHTHTHIHTHLRYKVGTDGAT